MKRPAVSGAAAAQPQQAVDAEETKKPAYSPLAPSSPSACSATLPCVPTKPTGHWVLGDRVLPVLILLLCIYTRFWNIHLPSGIVFDELHFGKFVNWTLFHWMYFDIHPPLAKLTLAYLSHLWGYRADLCDYEPPAGQSRYYAENPPSLESVAAGGPPCEYWKLRCLVAAFSVGACLLMYFCARRLGASVSGASLAFLLETFNILHNVEGRLILLNSQLLFWLNATLFAGLCWFAAANEAARAGRWLGAAARLRWIVLVGFLAGNAFSIKHTGLGTPAMLLLEGGLGLFFLVRPLPILDLLGMVAVMFATYSAYFGFHFWNFVYSHGQLRQETEFMSEEFQSLLIGSERYNPAARWTEGFWRTFYTFNVRMVVHSAAITQPHAWGTRPWEWIFNLRGVSYWGSTMGGGPDDKASIYLFGNPLINWGIVACLALLPVLAFLQQRTAWYRVGASQAVDFFRAGAPASPAGAAALGWAYVAACAVLTVRYYNDLSAFPTAQWGALGGAAACALLHLSSPPRALAIPHTGKLLVTVGLYALAGCAALGALGVYALGHIHGVEGEEHSGHSRLLGLAPALLGVAAASLQGWQGWAPPVEEGAGAVAAAAAGAAGGVDKPLAPPLQWAVLAAPVAWCVLGWLVNLVPYAAIHRTTFAYHYMPALVYGNLLIALLVDRLAGLGGSVSVAAATGAVWLFYRPWIFGYGLTEDEHARRRWLDRWN